MIQRFRPSFRTLRRPPRRPLTAYRGHVSPELENQSSTSPHDDGDRSASYMYKLNESKRRKALLAEHGHRQRVWAHNAKRDGAAFAAANGVSVAAVIIESVPFDALIWDGLPDRFVIKPVDGAANRGVFLLERRGPGFLDLIDGVTKTSADVVDQFRHQFESGRVSEFITVEELLLPRPVLRDRILVPDDFKAYCFYDRVEVVMQRRMFASADRSDWRFKFWSRDWNDLGAVKYPDRCDDSLQRPEGAADLVATAERLGRQLAVPFVRIDLYDTDRGAVFGEVSPHPGPPEVWTPELDEQLGQAWEVAEARLLAEGRAPNEPFPPDSI